MNKTADKVIWQSVCYVPIRIDPPLEFNTPNIWISDTGVTSVSAFSSGIYGVDTVFVFRRAPRHDERRQLIMVSFGIPLYVFIVSRLLLFIDACETYLNVLVFNREFMFCVKSLFYMHEIFLSKTTIARLVAWLKLRTLNEPSVD